MSTFNVPDAIRKKYICFVCCTVVFPVSIFPSRFLCLPHRCVRRFYFTFTFCFGLYYHRLHHHQRNLGATAQWEPPVLVGPGRISRPAFGQSSGSAGAAPHYWRCRMWRPAGSTGVHIGMGGGGLHGYMACIGAELGLPSVVLRTAKTTICRSARTRADAR